VIPALSIQTLKKADFENQLLMLWSLLELALARVRIPPVPPFVPARQGTPIRAGSATRFVPLRLKSMRVFV
jgi:hypothetical protein